MFVASCVNIMSPSVSTSRTKRLSSVLPFLRASPRVHVWAVSGGARVAGAPHLSRALKKRERARAPRQVRAQHRCARKTRTEAQPAPASCRPLRRRRAGRRRGRARAARQRIGSSPPPSTSLGPARRRRRRRRPDCLLEREVHRRQPCRSQKAGRRQWGPPARWRGASWSLGWSSGCSVSAAPAAVQQHGRRRRSQRVHSVPRFRNGLYGTQAGVWQDRSLLDGSRNSVTRHHERGHPQKVHS